MARYGARGLLSSSAFVSVLFCSVLFGFHALLPYFWSRFWSLFSVLVFGGNKITGAVFCFCFCHVLRSALRAVSFTLPVFFFFFSYLLWLYSCNRQQR